MDFSGETSNQIFAELADWEQASEGFPLVLLVERYDRAQHKDGTITRPHQEDFRQALGVPPEPGITHEILKAIRAVTETRADHLLRISETL